MKERKANFELLRIIAMLMIISLHYLDKGGVLCDAAKGPATPVDFLAWGIEALCVSSVNVYVLISAYFLADADYKPRRAVKVWAQTFFYSAGIFALMYGAGALTAKESDLYHMLTCLLPITEEHYWFVTAYILMILFAPLMNETLKKLAKETYQRGLLFLFLILSLAPTVLPVKLPTDRGGYDVIWFLFLYLLGVYIRIHGLAISYGRVRERNEAMRPLRYRAICFILYLLVSAAIFISMWFVSGVHTLTGKLGDFITRQYHYNSALCLAASVLLFLVFENLELSDEKIGQGICFLSAGSFGVYLIHEHTTLRYLWPQWFGVEKMAHTPLFAVHLLGTAVVIYLICALIDYVRRKLFESLKITH
ncbi:MAG: acyltransferase [Lachnospiraceae bacterium]|nr:acyltransferase [Lachnospiraceae bacterium]